VPLRLDVEQVDERDCGQAQRTCRPPRDVNQGTIMLDPVPAFQAAVFQV
jgi:hypothetical protein